jgi:hypothetical protein
LILSFWKPHSLGKPEPDKRYKVLLLMIKSSTLKIFSCVLILCAAPTLPQEELFSYRTLEARIPQNHPLRKLRAVVDLLLATLDEAFDALVCAPRPGLHSTGTPALHQSVASPVFEPLRAAVGGAHRLQPALPRVRRLDVG